MKIQCPNCQHEGNVPDDKIPESGVNVNCPKCKSKFLIKREAPQDFIVDDQPPPPPQIFCPKCGEKQPAAEACIKCGVVFSKFMSRQVSKTPEPSPPPPLPLNEPPKPQTERPVTPVQPVSVQQPIAPVSAQEKSLPLAIGLNFVLPGVGYIYMGKFIVGIFACLLIIGICYSTPMIIIAPTWIGLNVIMAIDMLILSSKNKKIVQEKNTKRCPNCAELIQREAKICRFCSTKFDEFTGSGSKEYLAETGASRHSTVGFKKYLLPIGGCIVVLVFISLIIAALPSKKGDDKKKNAESTVISSETPIAQSAKNEQSDLTKAEGALEAKTSAENVSTHNQKVSQESSSQGYMLTPSDFSYIDEGFGMVSVAGNLKNNTSKHYLYVQITFNAYDESGAQVGSTMANIANLEPYGVWKFKTMPIANDFKTIKFQDITAY